MPWLHLHLMVPLVEVHLAKASGMRQPVENFVNSRDRIRVQARFFIKEPIIDAHSQRALLFPKQQYRGPIRACAWADPTEINILFQLPFDLCQFLLTHPIKARLWGLLVFIQQINAMFNGALNRGARLREDVREFLTQCDVRRLVLRLHWIVDNKVLASFIQRCMQGSEWVATAHHRQLLRMLQRSIAYPTCLLWIVGIVGCCGCCKLLWLLLLHVVALQFAACIATHSCDLCSLTESCDSSSNTSSQINARSFLRNPRLQMRIRRVIRPARHSA